MLRKSLLTSVILASYCLLASANPALYQENEKDKFCIEEFQWGCTQNSDCCDEEHECFQLPPSDMNGLLGRCQRKAENMVESNTCIEDHQLGCHSVSGFECCNDDFMCINSRCQAVPTVLEKEKFCIEEFQWGCTQNSDCCDEEHECFQLPPSDMNGLLGRCQQKAENKVESNTCVEDHQLGCHSVSGFECCNDDFMCINSRCQPVPTVLAKDEKFCVDEFQWGCTQSSDCCNEEHKCYILDGPSDMNGLLGRCQPPQETKAAKICVSTWGCRQSSECCNKNHKCHMPNGPSDLNGLLGRCDF